MSTSPSGDTSPALHNKLNHPPQFQGQEAHEKPSFSHPLHEAPLWREEDLGKPIPNSDFAVSVTLPTWSSVRDYELGEPRVVNALQSGYPRFVINGATGRLQNDLKDQICRAGENLVLFPTEQSARRCLTFVQEHHGAAIGRVETSLNLGIAACIIPQESYKTARAYWQHCGEIVSSRRATHLLNGGDVEHGPSTAKVVLKERLAMFARAEASNVFLFPSGMAGVAALQRAVIAAHPSRHTAQVGFPYVDTLKLQTKFGNDAFLCAARRCERTTEEELLQLETRAKNGHIGAIYCEFPANPLLTVPPLERLISLSRDSKIPLIVDDTIASVANVQLLPYVTAVVTSLTKFVSGQGDVCAGSVILNPDHPAYDTIAAHFEAHYEDQLFAGDAEVLERNSRDFLQRMRAIGAGTAEVVEFLRSRPEVAEVFFPDQNASSKANYDAFRVNGGDYGGLFSLRLHGGVARAARFFDALEMSKGPSLGNVFSIVCPYTLLAHFPELPYVRQFGIFEELIRFSIGLEPPAVLINRIERALSASGS